MIKHIMSDIETLGVSNKPVFLSLGAVRFTKDEIVDRFHVGIDPKDCQRYGLEIDAGTAWDYWADPKQAEARDKLHALPKIDLFSALDGFAAWVNQTPADEQGSLWGNGATFDNVAIRSAYDAVQLDYPFHYRKDECYRTLKNRCPDVEYAQVGTAHDALDDAESQALHLQKICLQYGIML